MRMVDPQNAVNRYTLFHSLFLLHFTRISALQQQYDLHQYMDTADLAYHFGVSSLDRVPAYDLTSPTFAREYRDFPQYAGQSNWIYPGRIVFDVDAFDRRYRVDAVRNDRLVNLDGFVANFYGEGNRNLVLALRPKESQLRRHYLATSVSLFDDPDPNEIPSQSNSAFSLSPDGVHGLIQGQHSLFRLIPIKPHTLRHYAAAFDLRAEDLDLATHIAYEVSSLPIPPGMPLQFDPYSSPEPKPKNKKKKRRKKSRTAKTAANAVVASLKLGVIVDFSVYDVMMRWGFRDEQQQVFYVISFYNEVQLMYREPKLMRKLRLTVALQSIAFFTHPNNDLAATPHGEQYIENVCAGPYNNHDLDHVQTLTFVDIYDPDSRRTVAYTDKAEFELPQPYRYFWPGPPRQPRIYGQVNEANRLYDTVGLAWIGSTCDKRKHCSLVEMNSPIASFSAAHEIGHSIGVDHEEQSGCAFNSKDPENSSFMSEVSWSANSWATLGKMPVLTTCSVTAFVKAVKQTSKCLIKREIDRTNPAVDFKLAFRDIVRQPIEPNALCQYLMGELWINSQKWPRERIKRVFAPATAVGDAMCRSLDCKVVSVDEPKRAFGFKFGPAVPGTQCALEGQKVCFNFQCTDVNAIPGAALL